MSKLSLKTFFWWILLFGLSFWLQQQLFDNNITLVTSSLAICCCCVANFLIIRTRHRADLYSRISFVSGSLFISIIVGIITLFAVRDEPSAVSGLDEHMGALVDAFRNLKRLFLWTAATLVVAIVFTAVGHLQRRRIMLEAEQHEED